MSFFEGRQRPLTNTFISALPAKPSAETRSRSFAGYVPYQSQAEDALFCTRSCADKFASGHRTMSPTAQQPFAPIGAQPAGSRRGSKAHADDLFEGADYYSENTFAWPDTDDEGEVASPSSLTPQDLVARLFPRRPSLAEAEKHRGRAAAQYTNFRPAGTGDASSRISPSQVVPAPPPAACQVEALSRCPPAVPATWPVGSGFALSTAAP
eukprot:CAMPEP_0168372082 /NCGR_PEP_ID=MMETSP0228-20121227/8098_1 /TAXON_ID=133427 /ORGANISM="Protoceratium reticulatum, Strain CCCM 535 (=CCMP 1889)" /LENGTH=209 /DNA_ID=CAMNT_0008384979 /DNA_START=72 /DNA_END=698 /DNA_ORIENTATION=+